MFGARRAAAARAKPAGEDDAIEGLRALHELGARRALASDDVKREFKRVHEMLTRNRAEPAALLGDSKACRMARAAGELGAAVDGIGKATSKILEAADTIDGSAKSLGAALKGDFERRLPQDFGSTRCKSTRSAICGISPASASPR